MPYDGIIMRAVTNELNQKILNGRIEKIYQPLDNELLINIHNNTEHYKLLLSANPQTARVNLTMVPKGNPEKAPNFCLLLRKYLQNGKIKEIKQYGLDRIIEFYIDSANEVGDITPKIIVVEVMGKHSNIILLNSDRKIIDSIKHIDFETSRLREVLPGREYEYPETQKKQNILDADYKSIVSILEGVVSKQELSQRVVEMFSGVSPFLINTIIGDYSDNLSAKNINEILKKLLNFVKDVDKNIQKGILIYEKDKLKDFYINMTNSEDSYDNINETIDTYFDIKYRNGIFLNAQNEILKILNSSLAKCNKNIKNQNENLEKCKNAEKIRIYGELITANLYQIKNGEKSIIVDNYYEQPSQKEEIMLDETITPSQNAQRYFKKYMKMKNTIESAEVQLRQFEKEKEYLETVILQTELSKDIEELDEIKDELVNQGLIQNRKVLTKKETISEPDKYTSKEGFTIYVGKNNRQNDYLSLKFAKPNDMWLHVQKMPSSHVIIKTQDGNVPEETLLYAGELCAYHSKARFSKNVVIDYTFAKNVEKPRGAKPGFVIYKNFKSMVVNGGK